MPVNQKRVDEVAQKYYSSDSKMTMTHFLSTLPEFQTQEWIKFGEKRILDHSHVWLIDANGFSQFSTNHNKNRPYQLGYTHYMPITPPPSPVEEESACVKEMRTAHEKHSASNSYGQTIRIAYEDAIAIVKRHEVLKKEKS